MKLAELVAQFIEAQGIKHVFGVNGGANLHLIHGLAEASNVKFIPTTHECNAGFAADAYGRLTGLGCAMATSGPGATNLVTAIATSYYDSVPVLYITGNVVRDRMGARFGVRQYGFQETPIVEMVRQITKSAVQIQHPEDILYWLGEAVYQAKEGRPGPSLVDIPDDVQRLDVDPEKLEQFVGPRYKLSQKIDVVPVVNLLRQARRPIFVWGAGVRPYAEAARQLARSLGVPVACTWGAIDLMPSDDPLMAGGFGTHGTRAANFAVQNSDLLISIGSRLDTKATGDPRSFSREAVRVMVDIDAVEIRKFERLGMQVLHGICADAGKFIDAMRAYASLPYSEWIKQIKTWRARYDTPTVTWPGINPYELVKEIGKHTDKDTIICSDTGTALGYMMQGFPFNGERFLHAFNMTPMGYGLPAAIGAAFATGMRVVLVTGDGSLMMSMSDLATVSRWNLNIKIILLNNHSHAMCVQTERQWFGGRNASTTPATGLGFPNSFSAVAGTFGIPSRRDLADLFRGDGSGFLEVEVSPSAYLMPQARFGFPIEDAEPSLSREELAEQMLVPIL